MSTKYKSSKDVPTDALISRLKELSDAITGGRDSQEREFTMRIPAECDRDADLVIGEAASRLNQLQSEVERLRGRTAQIHDAAHELYSWCVEYLTPEQIRAGLASGHKIGQLLEFERPSVDAFVALKQAEAVDEFGNAFDRLHRVVSSRKVAEDASDYAQRLRQQAAEIEK